MSAIKSALTDTYQNQTATKRIPFMRLARSFFDWGERIKVPCVLEEEIFGVRVLVEYKGGCLHTLTMRDRGAWEIDITDCRRRFKLLPRHIGERADITLLGTIFILLDDVQKVCRSRDSMIACCNQLQLDLLLDREEQTGEFVIKFDELVSDPYEAGIYSQRDFYKACESWGIEAVDREIVDSPHRLPFILDRLLGRMLRRNYMWNGVCLKADEYDDRADMGESEQIPWARTLRLTREQAKERLK